MTLNVSVLLCIALCYFSKVSTFLLLELFSTSHTSVFVNRPCLAFCLFVSCFLSCCIWLFVLLYLAFCLFVSCFLSFCLFFIFAYLVPLCAFSATQLSQLFCQLFSSTMVLAEQDKPCPDTTLFQTQATHLCISFFCKYGHRGFTVKTKICCQFTKEL